MAAPPGAHPRTVRRTWLNLMSQPGPKASRVKRGVGLLRRHLQRSPSRTLQRRCSSGTATARPHLLASGSLTRRPRTRTAGTRAAQLGDLRQPQSCLRRARQLRTAAGSGRRSSSSKRRLARAERSGCSVASALIKGLQEMSFQKKNKLNFCALHYLRQSGCCRPQSPGGKACI